MQHVTWGRQGLVCPLLSLLTSSSMPSLCAARMMFHPTGDMVVWGRECVDGVRWACSVQGRGVVEAADLGTTFARHARTLVKSFFTQVIWTSLATGATSPILRIAPMRPTTRSDVWTTFCIFTSRVSPHKYTRSRSAWRKVSRA